MKFFKVLVLLTLLVSSLCLSSYERISHSKRMKGRSERFNSRRVGRTEKRTQTHKNEKNKAQWVNYVLGGVQLVVSSAGAVLTYYTKVTNMRTLNMMNEEYKQNIDRASELKKIEIETCSTLKLMRIANKHLYLSSSFKTSYLKYFLMAKMEKGKCPPHAVTKRTPFSECQMAQKIQRIKEKIDRVSPSILKEMRFTEEKICNQEVKYDMFEKENFRLDEEIKELEKTIEEEEENILTSLLGACIASYGTATTDSKEFLTVNWESLPEQPFNPKSLEGFLTLS